MNYYSPEKPKQINNAEYNRLEAVTVCEGFDDVLDVSLTENHDQLDTMIVVTSHDDRATQLVARKHGAVLVLTDLLRKNGRSFNKGAAVNAGLYRFQYQGWRIQLDADVALPDSFRRLLTNHTHLDPCCIYGADRADVYGSEELAAIKNHPKDAGAFYIQQRGKRMISNRYLDDLHGYVPIGYFQLWHASCDKQYPWSQGHAAHDDVSFAIQWPASHRRLLPSFTVWHLCARAPVQGENWQGNRKMPRWK